MKKSGRLWLHGLCVSLLGLTFGPANARVDAPELAQPGSRSVGLSQWVVDVGPMPDFNAAPDPQSPAPASQRQVKAWLWYPAEGPKPESTVISAELTSHPWRPLPKSPMRVSVPSVAKVDAPVAREGRFPVVVISHGLMNWAPVMSYLAEHLASRGYVVLGLEHHDEQQTNPLGAALYLRPIDQLAAIRSLNQANQQAGHRLHQRLAMDRLAVVGYSMGGYGALVSAGARVATDGVAFGYAPGRVLQRHSDPASADEVQAQAQIRAAVAIAPWGGQRGVGALRAAGLQGVKIPTLVIAGDQDDISGYADGVRSIWEGLSASSRWLLVFENARHNIGAQGSPPELAGTFAGWSAFEEPVWRHERILDINRHFITAFLDHTLLGDASRSVFLNPGVLRSNEGEWPQAWGTPATGQYAGAPRGDRTHWPGFQRRWAVGLRLEHRAPAAPKP